MKWESESCLNQMNHNIIQCSHYISGYVVSSTTLRRFVRKIGMIFYFLLTPFRDDNVSQGDVF